MKKPVNYSRLFSAVRFWISLFALAGFYQFLQWLRTSGIAITGEHIAAFVWGTVSMGLLVAFLIHVAETLLRQHRITKLIKSARARRTQDETPPEVFFAAHRQALETINEFILADAVRERQLKHIDYWYSDASLGAELFDDWSVALDDELAQAFESLGVDGLHVWLKQYTITYHIHGYKIFCVLQHSETSANWVHLDGRWYYDTTPFHIEDTERGSP